MSDEIFIACVCTSADSRPFYAGGFLYFHLLTRNTVALDAACGGQITGSITVRVGEHSIRIKLCGIDALTLFLGHNSNTAAILGYLGREHSRAEQEHPAVC